MSICLYMYRCISENMKYVYVYMCKQVNATICNNASM